jgi:rhodanese-related sulfurtransferase
MPPEDTADHAAILTRAQVRAKEESASFRGLLTPAETWALFKQGEIALVDTRTLAERDLVGYVPGSIVIEWYDYPAKRRNERFLTQLRDKVEADRPVAFLCRSGVRSKDAANLAAANGCIGVQRAAWLRRRQERAGAARRQQARRRAAWRQD